MAISQNKKMACFRRFRVKEAHCSETDFSDSFASIVTPFVGCSFLAMLEKTTVSTDDSRNEKPINLSLLVVGPFIRRSLKWVKTRTGRQDPTSSVQEIGAMYTLAGDGLVQMGPSPPSVPF